MFVNINIKNNKQYLVINGWIFWDWTPRKGKSLILQSVLLKNRIN